MAQSLEDRRAALLAQAETAREAFQRAEKRRAEREETARTLATCTEANKASKAAIAEKKTALSDHTAVVESFPTETQLLKLERRLETLKAQLADALRQTNQTKTGIDAYSVRCEASNAARRDLLMSLEDASEHVFEAVALKADEDRRLLPSSQIFNGIEELIAICDEREATLVDLNQRYAERLEEEGELNRRVVALQQKVEGEIPKIEADADRHVEVLTAAWNAEKEALQSAYDRLYAINKEQQHHLVRGTHVKREVPHASHEAALSARHNTISAQLIDARNRLAELQSDNAFAKKITDQLRTEGRHSLTAYEAQQAEVSSRLRDARDERLAAEEEARKFRNLKADLQQALQTIRETPCGISKTH